MENNLKVMIWGREVGRLSWDARRKRATFAKTSDVAKQVMELGGTKMALEAMQQYVNQFFLPKFKLRDKQ